MPPAPADGPAQAPVERFHPTSGRLAGVVSLCVSGLAVILAVVEPGTPTYVVPAALLVGLLAWAVMLRPALWAEAEQLIMRNAFETIAVPLAAIENVAVGRVTVVQAGQRRFISTVVHRRLRSLLRGSDKAALPRGEVNVADFVEERISQLAADARVRHGVRARSEEQRALATTTRRQPAWGVIGGVVVLSCALVVAVVLEG